MGYIVSSIIHFIGTYLFKEFGLYTLLYLCLSIFIKKPILKKTDQEATGFIAFAGLVYTAAFILWIVLSLVSPQTAGERYSLLNRMFGPYWFGVWMQPLLWIVLTQLLRIKKIQTNALARIVFSVLFIITFEAYVIIVTSLHRDYAPSNWAFFQPVPAIFYPFGILLNILLFMLFVGIFYGTKLLAKRIIGQKVNRD